ncbi:hypothetical protein [Marivirga sp.]|uniref:hypothetical protein n=1 Tax=Marivirga sp. TaxID=2018662 RepID=UPI003DA750A0
MLNQIFLGENSAVELKTNKSIDDIKVHIAKNYDKKEYSEIDKFSDLTDVTSDFIYSYKDSKLILRFSKEIKRKNRSSLDGFYPRFKGVFESENSKTKITGEIGLTPVIWWIQIIWQIVFLFYFLGG